MIFSRATKRITAELADIRSYSAQIVKDPGQAAGEKLDRRDDSWQRDILSYAKLIPELGFAAAFVGNGMSRMRLTIGFREPSGIITPAFGDDGTPLDPSVESASSVLGELRGKTGGQSEILKRLGRLDFLCGESFVTGVDAPDQRQWDVLSIRQLDTSKTGTYKRISPGKISGDPLPKGALVCRVWEPDDEFSELATSSVRACIDTLEKLVLVGRQMRSHVVSRLAGNGIYWIPSEIEFPPDPENPEKRQKFSDLLMEYMTTPIADRGSAAGVVPFIGRARADLIEKIRHDKFTPEADQLLDQRRKALVEELADGLDLPLEVLLGLGRRTSHWNAFQIDKNVIKNHFEPRALVICDCLTVGFLRPQLESEGLQTTTQDGRELVVWFDASELANDPNETQNAIAAYDRLEMAGSSFMRHLGFAENERPEQWEIDRRLGWSQILGKKGPAPTDQPADQTKNPGPPPEPGQTAAAIVSTRLADATTPYLVRTTQRAGARLKSKANGDGRIKALLSGVSDNALIPTTLGRQAAGALIPEGDLVRGEFLPLVTSARQWSRQMGADLPVDFDVALCDRLEGLALERMWDPSRQIGTEDFLDLFGEESPA